MPCPLCGKVIFQSVYLDGHMKSINCLLRRWQKRKKEEGWRKAKMSWRPFLEEHGIPYEVSPCQPEQGQCIYVPRHIYNIVNQVRVSIRSFTGRIWINRPMQAIQQQLKDAILQQKESKTCL